MVCGIAVGIGCAYFLYKKGAIKVELIKKPAAPAAEEIQSADGDNVEGDDVREEL